jgi:nitronate monooxygenase
MWCNTKATEMLGIKYPILQGPFGGNLSSVELVATVSNAGGIRRIRRLYHESAGNCRCG